MGRVNAQLVLAEMVYFQAGRYWAYRTFVGEPMGANSSLATLRLALREGVLPVFVLRIARVNDEPANPIPAAIRREPEVPRETGREGPEIGN